MDKIAKISVRFVSEFRLTVPAIDQKARWGTMFAADEVHSQQTFFREYLKVRGSLFLSANFYFWQRPPGIVPIYYYLID